MKYKVLAALAALVTAAMLMTSCSSPSANAPAGTADANGSPAKIIKVGTMGTYSPFSYNDENGNLTGYDIEVLRLLQTKMTGYQFEFDQAPWDSLFAGLDSMKYDMLANEISWSPERDAKYLFTAKGYIYAQTKLVVNGDDNTHTSLADFKGLTLGGLNGDAFTQIMEDYNTANGNPFTINYYDGEYVDIFKDIDIGRIAGTVNDTIVVPDQAKTLGLNIKCVGDVLEASPSYFVFRQDASGQEYKAAIDQAMDTAIADGSLSALSVQWFGDDYTQVPAGVTPDGMPTESGN